MGPSIINRKNGTIRFQTTGEIPPHESPERPFETGFMGVTWDMSESDPRFSDGYLRATLRADTPSDANLFLRSDVEQLEGYLFTGLGAIGRFQAYCFCDGGGLIGEISDMDFEVGQDYHMEVGAIGNKITMKAWRVGTDEPKLPQLVVFDDRLSEGGVGLIPALSPTLFSESTRIDVTYSSVKFQPSVPGDINQNSLLDVDDIDELTSAVISGDEHPFFDLNQDGAVDNDDRVAWVHDPTHILAT